MFVKFLAFLAAATVAVTVYARPSEGSGRPQVYRVGAHDTLWEIATAHYAGDPREAIWRIQQRNGLDGTTIRPGQRLVLP